MKGIILAGGAGTRMYPMTVSVSKQLLHVYDKPMIYYPLATLIEGGVTDVLIITQSKNILLFSQLLGEGEEFGIRISYAPQNEPRGIAESLLIAEDCSHWHADSEPIMLILGDNIFDGEHMGLMLRSARSAAENGQGTVFLAKVSDPQRYGVAAFEKGRFTHILEKPEVPPSDLAVTGLYVYPPGVQRIARDLPPSPRQELEITDVNQRLLSSRKLVATKLGSGAAWLDTGTPESMLQASHYVQTIQDRQARLVGSPHLAALDRQLIGPSQLQALVKQFPSAYSKALYRAAQEEAKFRENPANST